jgi:hypothetical protein
MCLLWVRFTSLNLHYCLHPDSMSTLLFLCSSPSTVTFESSSAITQIEVDACSDCLHVQSIEIPPSVSKLWPSLLSSSSPFSCFLFESDATLNLNEERAFADCLSLTLVCILASVRIIQTPCCLSCDSFSSSTFGPGWKLPQLEEGFLAVC